MKLEGIDLNMGGLDIFKDFSMDFPPGELCVILGPSGCGKTSLLNLLSGGLTAQAGKVEAPAPGELSYLFQQPVLLPWKTALENIIFILPEHWDKKKKQHTAQHYLELTDLGEFSHYYPRALSGGMKQRLAMARSFAYPGSTLFMDEPFTALDIKLKMNMMSLFQQLWAEDKRSCVMVTHQVQEALILGDRIVVLSSGPAQIILTAQNPLSPKERKPGHQGLQKIEQAVYQALLQ
ncbi:MAG: ABC transporter ATP-binding protein [Spirochaetaceae bacterium]|jgi:NitT/TauT family transport system ATP-binding protein|nr:ABC transporter ATP-binding protein [Spirochaetaceae bacterium]